MVKVPVVQEVLKNSPMLDALSSLPGARFELPRVSML